MSKGKYMFLVWPELWKRSGILANYKKLTNQKHQIDINLIRYEIGKALKIITRLAGVMLFTILLRNLHFEKNCIILRIHCPCDSHLCGLSWISQKRWHDLLFCYFRTWPWTWNFGDSPQFCFIRSQKWIQQKFSSWQPLWSSRQTFPYKFLSFDVFNPIECLWQLSLVSQGASHNNFQRLFLS